MFKKIIAAFISAICIMCGMLEITAFAEPYEVYNYDRLNDPIPSQAGYTAERSVSGNDLGAGELNSPSDIFYGADGLFYIVDSGNNRVIAVDENFTKAVKIYDSFIMPDGSETSLKTPMGIFISAADNNMYIADSENSRVLVSDTEGNIIKEIIKPDSEIFDQKRTFTPMRVIADKAGNIYVVLNNITTGAAMFAPDGEFIGFYGANRVQPTSEIVSEHLARLFMSDEKRARRVRNVPSGVTSFDIDGDFIFTCTSSSTQTTDTVKKLNAAGNNIFANMELNFGDYTPVYDTTRNQLLAPAIVDIDIAEDGNINCLDFTTGRIFQYDKDCNLLFITGTIAKQVGGFDQAAALESHGDKLYVADSMKNTVTIFTETDFGAIVHKASALHNAGYYDKALEPWLEVLRRDGNYRRANLGVALALLRQGDYKDAMKYAKLANAGSVYDKAFEGYRMELIHENFGTVVLAAAIIAAVFIILKKRRNSRNNGKIYNTELKPLQWIRYAIMHPFEGFEDMRWKKAGSLRAAFFIVILLFISQIAEERLYGFQFYTPYDKIFNVMPFIMKSFVLFAAWTVGNRAVCTFLDGEGTLRNICIYSAYALVPYIGQSFINTLLSHILIRDEYVFIEVIQIIGMCWTAVLLFSAVKAVHQYSFRKAVFAVIFTVAAMLIMLFLLVLFMSLIQQIYLFISTVYMEISYRLRS